MRCLVGRQRGLGPSASLNNLIKGCPRKGSNLAEELPVAEADPKAPDDEDPLTSSLRDETYAMILLENLSC